MSNSIHVFQDVLMNVSLCGLGLSALGMFIVSVVKQFHHFQDSKARRILFVFGAVCLSTFAATKHYTQFYFAVGLMDDGSYTTNDFVHIEWVKSGIPYVPNTSTVFIDYRHRESTNEWIELADVPVTKYFFDATIKNATNMSFNIWWHNEEQEVHTNGVWIYKTVRSRLRSQSTNTFDIIPARATTVVNGKIVAPPSKKE
jgi:hypothetical protein